MIFVFMLFIFPFVVLAFLDFSLLRTHFWPFTEVLREIRREVTRNLAVFLRITNCADDTDGGPIVSHNCAILSRDQRIKPEKRSSRLLHGKFSR